MTSRVLVVEDDRQIAAAVRHALAEEGHDVRIASSVLECQLVVHAWDPELVVLDLGLPDGDGIALCRVLRGANGSVRIVIVTARSDDLDAIVGLDAGANDYVTKPFAMAVLQARVRAHLRPAPPEGLAVLDMGPLRIEIDAHCVSVDGRPVELRPREFALLEILVRDRGRVVTHDRILSELWGSAWDRASRKSLETHIYSLRRKLGTNEVVAGWIKTIRGVGFRFDAP